MIRLLGLAWTAWKLSAKRLGPVGGAFVAVAAAVGFVLLRGYLDEHYPQLGDALDRVA